MNLNKTLISALFIILAGFAACKTKSEIRQEQEVERIKSELKGVKADRADLDVLSEEIKTEVTRMSNLIEDRAQLQKQQTDEVKRELSTLTSRVQSLEQRLANDDASEKQKAADRPKASFDLGKRYFDDGRYEDAAEVLKTVSRNRARTDEGKKAQFYLGETYFANKEFASAALEFSEFKKTYPSDRLVPQAIYRQANSFRSMNKNKEAKLFYQELMERFPKSPFAAKAKAEMKKIK